MPVSRPVALGARSGDTLGNCALMRTTHLSRQGTGALYKKRVLVEPWVDVKHVKVLRATPSVMT